MASQRKKNFKNENLLQIPSFTLKHEHSEGESSALDLKSKDVTNDDDYFCIVLFLRYKSMFATAKGTQSLPHRNKYRISLQY